LSKKDEAPGTEDQQANVNLEDALSESYDDLAAAEVETEDGLDVEETTLSEEGNEEEIAEGTEEDEPGHEEEIAQGEDDQVEYNEPAPERWPEELKTAYNALPPQAKQMMLEQVYKPMQRQYTESTQQMAEQRKALEPMLQTLNQHAQDFESAGINPVEAFNRQMAWSAHFAKVGPEQGARDLAKAYGQATGQEADKKDIYLTPVEKAQQREIDAMKRQLQDVGQMTQQQQEQAQQRAMQERQMQVRNTITAFANETRDGKPTHPHVEKVSAQMAGLIKGGLVARTDEYGQPVPYSQQLGQAYKMACEMDPSIRSVRDTRTRKEQVARASAANREVVSKSPSQDVNVENTGSLHDSISDLYDKMDRSVA
jgi:hypothetical protein